MWINFGVSHKCDKNSYWYFIHISLIFPEKLKQSSDWSQRNDYGTSLLTCIPAMRTAHWREGGQGTESVYLLDKEGMLPLHRYVYIRCAHLTMLPHHM